MVFIDPRFRDNETLSVFQLHLFPPFEPSVKSTFSSLKNIFPIVMDSDFDVLEFCRNLRLTQQPPYKCPVDNCDKTYKSMCGLQYHLVNIDHARDPSGNGPTRSTPVKNKFNKKKKSATVPQKDFGVSYNGNVQRIDFEIDHKSFSVRLDDRIPVVSSQNLEKKCPKTSYNLKGGSSKIQANLSKYPEPTFTVIDDYHVGDAPPRPLGYIRYIEKNSEEIEEEVEYDIDEEDVAWLEIINEKRCSQKLEKVSVDDFEILMDRLEKESVFVKSDKKEGPSDDEAICCICQDGECQNTNVILFCDMCDLAVHQDCYGVPYIPEGHWLCRRCLQSPSKPVDCVLCPNNDGAFKQTDRGHWAHVVCAMWIPEVRFANAVFLEPIDSIETITAARWKLTCYICNLVGVGACIQCNKTSCTTAFHVTCGLSAGLHMVIDPTTPRANANKTAYCANHAPPDSVCTPKPKQNSTPIVSVPTIPPEKIQEIASLVTLTKKNRFIHRLIAYWTLKRHLRNGVPLLRTLQLTDLAKKTESSSDKNTKADKQELQRQYKYWMGLRRDMERARLLCELIRKREKLKRELIKMKEQCMEIQLCPLVAFMRRVVNTLRSYDTGEIFIEPVDEVEVPTYRDVISHPMDLSTMRDKVDSMRYETFNDLIADFNLMVDNCLLFNAKNSIFYKAGVKMKEQGSALLIQAKKDLEDLKLDSVGMEYLGREEEEDDEQSVSDIKQSENESCDRSLEEEKKSAKRHSTLSPDSSSPKKKKGGTRERRKSSKNNEESENLSEFVKNHVSHIVGDMSTDSPSSLARSSGSAAASLSNRHRSTRSEHSNNSDNFSTYRIGDGKSDEESQSEEDSSCSRCSWSDSETECADKEEGESCGTLEQLQLVWAKCRGYPWYPALIINPAMPPDYTHNGVPIPKPPPHVLQLANKYTEPVYLVLFFDKKRTWQWLPRPKLQPLGITYELDLLKLTESKKPSTRKEVKKAYQEAMTYRTEIDKTIPDPAADLPAE